MKQRARVGEPVWVNVNRIEDVTGSENPAVILYQEAPGAVVRARAKN